MSQSYRQLLASDLLSDSRGFLNDSDEALRSFFAGAVEPPSPVAYQSWADTANGYLKQRTGANDSWVIIGVLGSSYGGALPRSGGTMTGAINAGGFALTNLGLGTGTSAARQQELDLKAPIAGPQFTGDARVNQDPASNDSLIRRSWAEGRYAKLGGSTQTGPLFLSGNAALTGEDLRAVPFQQVRDFVSFNVTAGHRHDGADARHIRGVDLDSGSAPAGRPLVSSGAGDSVFALLDFLTGIKCAFGQVTAAGTIGNAGSGNWSVARPSTGVYNLTIAGGVFSVSPAAFAMVNSPPSDSYMCNAVISSVTAVQIRTSNLGSLGNSAFSFLIA